MDELLVMKIGIARRVWTFRVRTNDVCRESWRKSINGTFLY